MWIGKMMQIFAAAGLGILFLAPQASARAAGDLTAQGAQLTPVTLTDVASGIVEKQIDVNGDVVQATHIVVQLAGSPPLMRNIQGVFQPWDVDPASLADNGFTPDEGRLLFKVFNQDLSEQNFPIRVTIYYRASGELKFGYFDVMRTN